MSRLPPFSVARLFPPFLCFRAKDNPLSSSRVFRPTLEFCVCVVARFRAKRWAGWFDAKLAHYAPGCSVSRGSASNP